MSYYQTRTFTSEQKIHAIIGSEFIGATLVIDQRHLSVLCIRSADHKIYGTYALQA